MSMGQPNPQPTQALARPYGAGKRAFYGLMWVIWTLVLTVAGFSLMGSGSAGTGLIALVLAVLAGWYDYKIWTYRAKWLMFLIII